MIEALAVGEAALAAGRWNEARHAFRESLESGETAAAQHGLSLALWWLGENRESVAACTRAYTLYRRSGDPTGAVQCAVWLAITYKANFGNASAANGWLARADRLLEPLDAGPLHAWVLMARAYRLPDLDTAESLTSRALDLCRAAGDTDGELAAQSQLGLIQVARGRDDAGFALIDEVMAVVLAGERATLDVVAYACCDMLSACELASDLARAAEWCRVADDFVATYGCPFLYAECRIYYGSVLAATGRWDDAERELTTGLQITDGVSPGLHARAATRIAALRVRQGRLEEAGELLRHIDEHATADAEAALSRAALELARGDAVSARRTLERRLHRLAAHGTHLAAALDLLVDAHLDVADVEGAAAVARRLADSVGTAQRERLTASATEASGRVAGARGDVAAAVEHLEAALVVWSRLNLPYEVARSRLRLAEVLAPAHPEMAVEHAGRALTSFESLGAALDADRAAALLRSLGVATRPGPKGLGSLTSREREVLGLVGAGLSNPEIAARLYVSRKTAAHHVSHILTKLGLRNRAEAAAYAAHLQP